MRTRGLLVVAALAVGMLSSLAPAEAVSVNSLSFQGTMGRIRVRPVLQNRTGATVLQQGDANKTVSRPNRTVGDDVIPMIENTPGLRIAGNNPFNGGDGHTHYHPGDTQILLNDVSGFLVGDTIYIGSPYCNFGFLNTNCKKSSPAINEQPFGQVNYIVGGDVGPGFFGPGVVQLAYGLVNSPRCSTGGYGACAFTEGQPVVKMPTLYQGQQFRVDIPHTDIVYGSPNDVVVTAEFIPPQGSHDPNYPRRPLSLNRDNPTDFDVIIDNACGGSGCGAGFVSFYIPKEITGTGTIGRTFSVDTPDTWYTVYVKAVDVTNPAIVRSDGLVRFKLNPTAILDFKTDKSEIVVTEAVVISGKLRDNSTAAGLAQIPVEDVIVDVKVTRPSGISRTIAATSCVDTDPGAADTCGTNPFGGPGNNHGGFAVKVGGLQGLFIGIPNVPSSTLNCSAGQVNPLNPYTYDRILGVAICALNPLVSAFETLETGTYDVLA